MYISTGSFYTRLCDDWEDAVGESLMISFETMMEEIRRACDEINSQLGTASHILERAQGTFASCTLPTVPGV